MEEMRVQIEAREPRDEEIRAFWFTLPIDTEQVEEMLMPYGVSSVLYNIVDAYNKEKVQRAKKEHRKSELLSKVSAHVMRHTACTRMSECRMDIKVLQVHHGTRSF